MAGRVPVEYIEAIIPLSGGLRKDPRESIFYLFPESRKFYNNNQIVHMLHVLPDNKRLIQILLDFRCIIIKKPVKGDIEETSQEDIKLIIEASRIHIFLCKEIEKLVSLFKINSKLEKKGEEKVRELWGILNGKRKEELINWAYDNMLQ